MTQEKEQLLLKELGARLRYRVVISKKVCHKRQLEELSDIGYGQETDEIYVNGYPIKNCKPYLRPLSSMTDEEVDEYNDLCGCNTPFPGIVEESVSQFMDWLNAHHFDYRGLIEKGLALEAPEDMYK